VKVSNPQLFQEVSIRLIQSLAYSSEGYAGKLWISRLVILVHGTLSETLKRKR
jgi:hypothetical protein